MGNCPYCRSVTLPGDTICYSCGRVLANIKSPNFAAEQQFNRGSVESTYLKTRKPTKSGMVMTQSGKRRNILKRRKNRFRSVVMLGLVAFIMLSPQAREVVWEKYAGVVEYVQLATAPYHLYPKPHIHLEKLLITIIQRVIVMPLKILQFLQMSHHCMNLILVLCIQMERLLMRFQNQFKKLIQLN